MSDHTICIRHIYFLISGCEITIYFGIYVSKFVSLVSFSFSFFIVLKTTSKVLVIYINCI